MADATLLATLPVSRPFAKYKKPSGPEPVVCSDPEAGQEAGRTHLVALRSQPSETQTTITFANLHDGVCRLLWVNFQGEEIAYGKLEPDGNEHYITFASHVWVARDIKTGNRLCINGAQAIMGHSAHQHATISKPPLINLEPEEDVFTRVAPQGVQDSVRTWLLAYQRASTQPGLGSSSASAISSPGSSVTGTSTSPGSSFIGTSSCSTSTSGSSMMMRSSSSHIPAGIARPATRRQSSLRDVLPKLPMWALGVGLGNTERPAATRSQAARTRGRIAKVQDAGSIGGFDRTAARARAGLAALPRELVHIMTMHIVRDSMPAPSDPCLWQSVETRCAADRMLRPYHPDILPTSIPSADAFHQLVEHGGSAVIGCEE